MGEGDGMVVGAGSGKVVQDRKTPYQEVCLPHITDDICGWHH